MMMVEVPALGGRGVKVRTPEGRGLICDHIRMSAKICEMFRFSAQVRCIGI